jgi:predicted component of type VI protein secretion system
VKERKFANIDRDHFNDVLAHSAPHLALESSGSGTTSGASVRRNWRIRKLGDRKSWTIYQARTGRQGC